MPAESPIPMLPTNVITLPTARRFTPAERGAIHAWAAGFAAVRVAVFPAEEPDMPETAVISVFLPGDAEEDARSYTLARVGHRLVIHDGRDRAVVVGRSVVDALCAFGRMLPGAPG